jgi:hypothetical protein
MDDDLARLALFPDSRYKAAVTVDVEAPCVTVSTQHFFAGAATALSQPDHSMPLDECPPPQLLSRHVCLFMPVLKLLCRL